MTVSIPDCFMIAFSVGLIFGLFYEILRIIRLILRFRFAVFICDVAFFIISAFCVCKLSEFLGSYVRLYTVLGFGAGIFTYIATIGRLFNILESAASIAWRKTLGKLFRKFSALIKKLTGKMLQKFKAFFVTIHEYSDKLKKNHQGHLNLNSQKMYNNKGNNLIGEGEEVHVIKAKVRKSS